MTNAEWLRLSTYVDALWPSRGWPESTVEAVAPAFATLEIRHVKAALAESFRDGREFPPSPSVVFARAEVLQRGSLPALDEPDLTRDLTPDEVDRAARWRPRIQAAIADLAERKNLNGTGQ